MCQVNNHIIVEIGYKAIIEIRDWPLRNSDGANKNWPLFTFRFSLKKSNCLSQHNRVGR
jgi:hypothetical protein